MWSYSSKATLAEPNKKAEETRVVVFKREYVGGKTEKRPEEWAPHPLPTLWDNAIDFAAASGLSPQLSLTLKKTENQQLLL